MFFDRYTRARTHAHARTDGKETLSGLATLIFFASMNFVSSAPSRSLRDVSVVVVVAYFLTSHEIVNDNRGGEGVNILISELNSEGYVGGVTFMIYFEGFGAQTRCCHARGIFQRYFDDGNSIRAVASSGQRNRSDRRPSTSVYRKFIRPTDM